MYEKLKTVVRRNL